MNKIVLIIVALAIIGGGAFYFLNQKQSAPAEEAMMKKEAEKMSKNEVVIQNFSFSPSTITVKAGETVTWTNKDSVGHTATADDGEAFDTPLIEQDQSESVTFTKAGTYTYHCTPHPTMKATVIVE